MAQRIEPESPPAEATVLGPIAQNGISELAVVGGKAVAIWEEYSQSCSGGEACTIVTRVFEEGDWGPSTPLLDIKTDWWRMHVDDEQNVRLFSYEENGAIGSFGVMEYPLAEGPLVATFSNLQVNERPSSPPSIMIAAHRNGIYFIGWKHWTGNANEIRALSYSH